MPLKNDDAAPLGLPGRTVTVISRAARPSMKPLRVQSAIRCSHISFCVPYEVCGAGRVSSATTSGNGTAGSGPNTATELENTEARRIAGACAAASSSARVLSRFERMPRSKSASHSPDTADARWNTPSKRFGARGRRIDRAARRCVQPRAGRPAGRAVARTGRPAPARRSRWPASVPRASSVRASRAPTKPAPPVIRSFMVSLSGRVGTSRGRPRCRQGRRDGSVFAADPAAVAERVDQVEQVAVVDFADIGLVALGHAGDLQVADAAGRQVALAASWPDRPRRSGSGTGPSAPSGWARRPRRRSHARVLPVEEEAGNVARVDRLDQHVDAVRCGLCRGPRQIGDVGGAQRLRVRCRRAPGRPSRARAGSAARPRRSAPVRCRAGTRRRVRAGRPCRARRRPSRPAGALNSTCCRPWSRKRAARSPAAKA